jgi:predicted GNAT family N-acyltransferase
MHDSQMVGEQLKRNNVQQTLQAINRLRNSDSSVLVGDVGVIRVADDDRGSLSGSHLLQGTLNFLLN